MTPASQFIRQNTLGLVAIFIALSGTAWAAGKIGGSEIQKNAVHAKHIKKAAVGSSDIQPDAVRANHIKDGEVRAAEIKNGQVRSLEVLDETLSGVDIADDSLSGDDISDGSVERVDLADEAQGPAGYEWRDNDTGEICNDGCTEGSLALPPGFYAIFGKIVLDQELPEAVSVHCELTNGGVVFDQGQVFQASDHSVVTLQMQGVRLLLDRGDVNLNCGDNDVGNVSGSDLNITAINLGLVSSSTP